MPLISTKPPAASVTDGRISLSRGEVPIAETKPSIVVIATMVYALPSVFVNDETVTTCEELIETLSMVMSPPPPVFVTVPCI